MEVDIYKDNQQAIFDEHMFTPFIVPPMPDTQVKRLLLERLQAKYPGDEYLNVVWDNMFTLLFGDLKSYTTNFNEYEYFFTFLYPYYTTPLRVLTTPSEIALRLKKPLVDSHFKKLVAEVKSSLFMHLTSREDVATELAVQDEEKFQKAVLE